MKPYFDTSHVAGLLFLIVVLAWAAMELSEFSRMQPGRGAPQRLAGVASGSRPHSTSVSFRSSGDQPPFSPSLRRDILKRRQR